MSNVQKNDNLSTPSARKMTGIIDVHSHIITNLGSQAPMDKLPAWSIEQSLSLMDANGIAFSDTDVSSIAHQNAESLYPALAGRLQQSTSA